MYRTRTCTWSTLALLALLALPVVFSMAQVRPAMAAAPVGADESAVSVGSWFCSRYAEAVAAPAGSDPAADVLSAVRSFALGYVHGVADAASKPHVEGASSDRRIIERLGSRCSEDPTRAVRDATLLAGRSMLEDAPLAPGKPAPDATGTLACSDYLAARGASEAEQSPRAVRVRDWVDGYINARLERAGRGLIPTPKNKALMLERFAAACTATPAATVREAARSVVESTLPGR
jgi:hypothetical protein